MDPEFVEILEAFPPLQFVDPAAQRATLATIGAQLPEPPWPDGVQRDDRIVPCADGHQVPVRVY